MLRQLFSGPHFLLELGTQCRDRLLQGIGSLLHGKRQALECLSAASQLFQGGSDLFKALPDPSQRILDVMGMPLE